MTLISEFQYFGSINYYKTLFNGTYVHFDIYNVYRKMSFRNRCLIAGGNNIIELSVPLVNGRNQRVPMKEVEIDNTQKWQVQHWRSITSAYGKSPWFEYYAYSLEGLYEASFRWLWEWDEACWKWTLEQLKHPLQWETGVPATAGEDTLNVTDTWLPKNYRDERPGFSLVRYPQVFEDRHGFLPNLSVLDLIFCMGPAAGELLITR